jgi:hypothetical protein
MVNFTSLSCGKPGRSSGNTSKNSQTTGIEVRSEEGSILVVTSEAGTEGIRRDILCTPSAPAVD